MKLRLKQKPKITTVQAVVGIGLLSIIVFTIMLAGGLFKSKESYAIPSNAASFSELCYTVSDGGGTLYQFNKNSGSPSSVGATAINSPEASTLNLIGDSLFVVDGSDDEFGYVNLSTGAFTVISSTFTSQRLSGVDGDIVFDDIDAMTVDNDDVFWVASRDNNDVDPSYIAKIGRNGTFIENAFGVGVDYIKFNGPDGFPSVLDAMAFDPVEEVLYVCANDGSGNPTYNNLMSVNTSTGAGTLIGNFNIGDVEGLGFDGEGNMYATTGTSSNTTANRNSFFSVDKSNAVATRVFTFSSGTDFETCDCVIGYKNTIKGTVFFDADEGGFQNNGESGLAGVTVSLYYDENNNGQYDAGTDGFVRSTTTNNLGEYVLVDAYETGTLDYVITINTGDLPSGGSLTTDNVEIASFSSGGNIDLYNDFGYKISSSTNNTISGYVYSDDDQGQDFDSGESGISGATVYLYQDLNSNGTYDSGTDAIVTSTSTASDGSYSFTRPFVGGSILSDTRISFSSGDGEESGGSLDLTSSDLDIGDKSVGMIFSSVSIPQGATIESAYVELVSRSSSTSTTAVTIYGEDVDNAATFAQASKISDRTSTSATESWIIPYWSAADITYQSPDITDIVQEIVNRSGWSSGNAMNIMMSETSGNRSAKSYNNSTTEAPRLVVRYTDPTVTDAYLTFVDESTLPTGSSLTTDNIETASFSSGGNTDPNNNFGVYRDASSINTVSGTVFHDNNGNGVKNGSSDAGENNVTVCLFNDANANGTYDSDVDVLLQIVKTDVNGEFSFEQVYAASSIEVQSTVSQSSDDADGSTITTTSTDLDIGTYDNAVRFQNVAVPQGATITSAYIEFTAEENGSGSYSAVIEGIDVNSASTFSNSQNLSSLSKTSNTETWSGSDSWTIDAPKTTPDITDIVQEIVNRGGWSSGNDMGFVINAGSGDRAAHSYDSDPAKAPKLVVNYQTSTVSYVVIIKQDNLPNGYSMTTDNLEVASFSSGGNSDTGNDFGYELNTAGLNIISGTVFSDENQNQSQNGSESGVANATIRLYDDADCDGQIDAGESILATTTSNGNGEYSFNSTFGITVEQRISQSSDDADESTLSLTSSDLDIAQSAVALRFTQLEIPQGATISSAYIEFTAEANKSGSYSVTIEGVDVDNASTFSASQNLGALARTTQNETMSGSSSWTLDETYNSPSLVSIVQEIVNRSGWASNNAMAFIINTGSGDRDAYSYDNDAGKAPRLIVEYTPSNKCYISEVVTSSIAQGGSLTTASIQTASFTSSGNTDSGNDFGVYYAPLPVELVSFTGSAQNGQVELEWLTANEINNDRFEIEWSREGQEFSMIGTVNGNGNDPDGESYEYVHNTPSTVNFYRLKQVDFDGTFAYSDVVKVEVEKSSQDVQLSVYPNPFNTELNVSFNSETDQVITINLLSSDGRTVYSEERQVFEGEQNVLLQVDNSLEPGSYLLQVQTTSGTTTKRVIKQ